jgi:hypothetical protein
MPAAHVSRLELYTTPDITLRPNTENQAAFLLNPANTALVGTKLPYFPMPDAPPEGLASSMWGGMEAGENMFYATQVYLSKRYSSANSRYLLGC